MNLSLNPANFAKMRTGENKRTEKDIMKLIKSAGFNLIDYDGSLSDNLSETAEFLDEIKLHSRLLSQQIAFLQFFYSFS